MSSASHTHERAVAILRAQLLRQLALPYGVRDLHRLPMSIPGGSRPTNAPDLMMVAAQTDLDEGATLALACLVVVEGASPSMPSTGTASSRTTAGCAGPT